MNPASREILAPVFTATGALHFLAFSLFFGAALLRLFAVKFRQGRNEPRPEWLRHFDKVYFNIGGICIMALFASGMVNVFANIFMGMKVEQAYLVTLGWKLAAALLVILFFIGDLMMSRREKHSPHMLAVQAALFVAAGILGFYLLEWRPEA
ncbi:hypothetical protein HY522_08865 [bacterium]|nr:hypothetical protein [bacterium]